MKTEDIIQKFESKDSHSMWEATWAILQSKDTKGLKELMPSLGRFREICESVNMGGAFRNNNHSADLAFLYVENICKGVCRCALYPSETIFDPRREEEQGFISISKSELFRELYEEHFWVKCNGCKNEFKIREIVGGHVPWWDWRHA